MRGFALKFYTEQGNWDLVGNNTPVFFIRDPLKFPDFIHTQKRDPRTNLRSATAAWDFWSRHPESLHQVTILFSDRGIPRSLREMNGYGSHTFSFINSANERFWVKFHFKTEQGHRFYTDEEAATAVGQDRETSQADLFNAIERGDFPRWKVYVQVMPEAEAQTYSIHPFDLTKVWPHKDYPLIPVGVLELNQNPDNFASPTWSRPPSPRPTWCPASASRRIACCRGGSSPTVTPSAIASASTTACCRSTPRAARSTTVPTATAPCGRTATVAPAPTTSQTASAPSSRASSTNRP